MTEQKQKIDRRDKLIAVFLCLCVLLSAAGRLDYDCPWGDDFAAYLNDALAIAGHRYDEQIRLNYRMHPTPLPREAGEEELVYVWGYPLALSLLVPFAGFDRTDYHSILYYKLPSVFSLALTAGLLYLFYRRRLARPTAVLLSVCVCFAAMDEVDCLYSDIFFLFLHVACLTLGEFFCQSLADGDARRALPRGIALGLALLAAYETRLNGFVDCVLVAGVQLLSGGFRFRRGERRSLLPLVPWLVFGVSLGLCTLFVLHPATSNISDMAAGDRAFMRENRSRYEYLLYLFLTTVPGVPFLNTFVSRPPMMRARLLALLPLGLTLLGAGSCLRRDRAALPYLVDVPVSLLVLILLPYYQGLRYCFPFLPLLALFFGMGLERAAALLARRLGKQTRARLAAGCLALSLLVAVSASASAFRRDLAHVLAGDIRRGDTAGNAYSDSALDMYRYIQANTPPDCVIAFFKPRALYLNTGRESFTDHVNGNDRRPRDYILAFRELDEPPADLAALAAFGSAAEPVYENADFILYRIKGGGAPPLQEETP